MMTNHTSCSGRTEFFLYVTDGERESEAAIALLNSERIAVRVISFRDREDDRVTPWLSTPTTGYYGLDSIRDFVSYAKGLENNRAS
jgi:hypothetical protein